MDSYEGPAKLLRVEAAPVLEELMLIMADPTAKARERLRAVRQFKKCLISIARVVETQQTAPALHRQLVGVLRKYHNGIASAYASLQARRLEFKG
jgi:hypothetical protein